MSKNKAESFFNDLIKEGAKVPGVGKYDPVQPKMKILGNYTQKDSKGGITDDSIFKGMTSPSPYNSVDLEVYKPKTLFAKMYKPSDKSPGPKPSSLSPLSYKVDEAFDKTQRTRQNIVIFKTAKDSFTD